MASLICFMPPEVRGRARRLLSSWRFAASRARRSLGTRSAAAKRCVLHDFQGRGMIEFKLQQLVEQIVGVWQQGCGKTWRPASMAKASRLNCLTTRTRCRRGSTSLARHEFGQAVEVVVASDQIIADLHQGIAEAFVPAADQGGGVIDLVALVTSWKQACAAGDGVGIGVVLDRPHLASEVGRGDDVDAWNGQQQDVGRLDEIAGDVSFQSRDLLGFLGEVIVQVRQDPLSHQGILVGRIGVLGPGQDAEQRRSLKTDPLLLEQLRQALGSRRRRSARRKRIVEPRSWAGPGPRTDCRACRTSR